MAWSDYPPLRIPPPEAPPPPNGTIWYQKVPQRAWAPPDRRAPEGARARPRPLEFARPVPRLGFRGLGVFALGLVIGITLGYAARALRVPGFVIDIPVEDQRRTAPLPSRPGAEATGGRAISSRWRPVMRLVGLQAVPATPRLLLSHQPSKSLRSNACAARKGAAENRQSPLTGRAVAHAAARPGQ